MDAGDAQNQDPGNSADPVGQKENAKTNFRRADKQIGQSKGSYGEDFVSSTRQ